MTLLDENVDDDGLVRLHLAGERTAFDALFARHFAPAYHFACSLLGNTDAAEEVMQESFLCVVRALPEYEPQGRFRAWLLRIVRNRCLHRSAGAGPRASEPGPQTPELASRTAGPLARMVAEERLTRVRSALAELPERQREAVWLFAVEGLKYHEIAGLLELPVNTVKTLIHRARAALACALDEEGR